MDNWNPGFPRPKPKQPRSPRRRAPSSDVPFVFGSPSSPDIFGPSSSASGPSAQPLPSSSATSVYGQPRSASSGTFIFGQPREPVQTTSVTNLFQRNDQPATTTSATNLFQQPAQPVQSSPSTTCLFRQSSQVFQSSSATKILGKRTASSSFRQHVSRSLVPRRSSTKGDTTRRSAQSTSYSTRLPYGQLSSTPQQQAHMDIDTSQEEEPEERDNMFAILSAQLQATISGREDEDKSAEELRWEHYQTQQQGAPQQSSFGWRPSQSTFGQTPQPPREPEARVFGQNVERDLFGQQQQQSGGVTFGQQETQRPVFGQQQQQSGGVTFGQQETQRPAFGQQQPDVVQQHVGGFAVEQQQPNWPRFGQEQGFGGQQTQPSTPVFGQQLDVAQQHFGGLAVEQQQSQRPVFGQQPPDVVQQHVGGFAVEQQQTQWPRFGQEQGFSGQQTQSSTPLFGQQQQSGVVTFGQQETQRPFGQQQPDVVQQHFSGFAVERQQTQRPLFGQEQVHFGQPQDGGHQTQYPMPVFGQQQPNFAQQHVDSFGFGQQQTQGPLFGQTQMDIGQPQDVGQPQPVFGHQQVDVAQQHFGGFAIEQQQTQRHLFGQPHAGGFTFGLQPQSSTTVFGQQQTQQHAGGSTVEQQQTKQTFLEQVPAKFWQPQAGGFTFGRQPQSTMLVFGQQQQQPSDQQPTQMPVFGQQQVPFAQPQPDDVFGQAGYGYEQQHPISEQQAMSTHSFENIFEGSAGASTSQMPTGFQFGAQTEQHEEVHTLFPSPQQRQLSDFRLSEDTKVALQISDQFGLPPALPAYTMKGLLDTSPAALPSLTAEDVERVLEQRSTSSTSYSFKHSMTESLKDELIDCKRYSVTSRKRLTVKRKAESPIDLGRNIGDPEPFRERVIYARRPQGSPTSSTSESESSLSSGWQSSVSLPDFKPLKRRPSNERQTSVTLQRPLYYCVPSIDELEAMRNEDGSCYVTGFTVGKIGYGNVYFPDTMDVSNLNLDEIVHIRHREIIVYPDESTKPPVGEGLNRRAMVTLDTVYPIVRGRSMTRPNREVLGYFLESLRRKCRRKGMRFTEYRQETGSFVFEVDHFSKYGLVNVE